MEQTISITNKWQIHIPVKLRAKLKLLHPTKATVKVVNNSLVLTPIKNDIEKLAGKYAHLYKKKPINIDKIRDHIDYSGE